MRRENLGHEVLAAGGSFAGYAGVHRGQLTGESPRCLRELTGEDRVREPGGSHHRGDRTLTTLAAEAIGADFVAGTRW